MKKNLLFLAFVLSGFAAIAQNWNYPETPKQPVYDTIWGKVIKDDYRWMEDMKNENVVEWFQTQAKFTKNELAKIPGRDQLLKELKEIDGMRAAVILPVGKAGGKYFYSKRNPAEQSFKLYMNDGNGKEKLLFDGAKHVDGKKFGFKTAMNEDGSMVALLLSEGGSEVGDLKFMETATGKILPDIIPNVTGANFVEGSRSEVIYTSRSSSDIHNNNARLNNPCKLHVIGTDLSQDLILVSVEKYPELSIKPEAQPLVYTFKNSPYMILKAQATERNLNLYYAPKSELKKNKINWKKLAGDSEEVRAFFAHDNSVYLSTTKGNPYFKLIRTTFRSPDIANADVIAEGNSEWSMPADFISQNNDYLVFTRSKYETTTRIFLYAFRNGKISELKGNYRGNLYSFSGLPGVNKSDDEVLLTNSGWNAPLNFISYDPRKKQISDSPFSVTSQYAGLDDIVIEEFEIPSHDGEMVPLSL